MGMYDQPFSIRENRCTCVDGRDPLCPEHWDHELERERIRKLNNENSE
jgi:hypothetical protein